MKSKVFLLILVANSLNIIKTKETAIIRLPLISNRIVNGREARIEDFPFQLSLRRSSIHICGASVLSPLWAITAAHCIEGAENNPRIFTLRMGSAKRNRGGRLIPVGKIYVHPSYNSVIMNYDVALLRTQPHKMTGKSVLPISLPSIDEQIQDNKPATVSGWGHMSSTEHVLSTVLKYTTVLTVNQNECNEDMKYHGGITNAMFCAAAGRTDACQGDSGGPIHINHTLIGVVSWGVGCADPHYPGVYTRLAYPPIRRWIKLLTKL